MARTVPVKWRTFLACSAFAAYSANFLTARYLDYPFMYCWVTPITAPLYTAWGFMILYVSIAYTVYGLFSHNLIKAFIGFMSFAVVIEFPRLVSFFFELGGSCG